MHADSAPHDERPRRDDERREEGRTQEERAKTFGQHSARRRRGPRRRITDERKRILPKGVARVCDGDRVVGGAHTERTSQAPHHDRRLRNRRANRPSRTRRARSGDAVPSFARRPCAERFGRPTAAPVSFAVPRDHGLAQPLGAPGGPGGTRGRTRSHHDPMAARATKEVNDVELQVPLLHAIGELDDVEGAALFFVANVA